MGLSIAHLVLLLAVVVLLFGRGRIASLMGDFGKGMREFKRGLMPQPVPRTVVVARPQTPRAIADLRQHRS